MSGKKRTKVTVRSIPLADLVESERNPRIDHPVDQIAASISKFGNLVPIVVQRGTNRILAGHGRLKALRKLGHLFAPVIEADHDDKLADLFMLADNKLTEKTGWDEAMLADIFAEYDAAALEVTGFDNKEIRRIVEEFGKAGSETPETEAPEPPVDPVSMRGDIWQLGDHRLMCGDSTSEEDVAALMDGGKADMVFTDPPYALFGNSTGVAGVCDDKMVVPFFREIGKCCLKYVKVFGHIYICCDWHSALSIQKAMQDVNLTAKNLCIWDKGDGGIGANYQNAYEMIWFFSASPLKSNTIGKKQAGERVVHGVSNVWRAGRTQANRLHNAQKPVGLVEIPVKASSDDGEIVLDLFLGSGTTIIAAENLGRRCFAMEISPQYVDVAVKRWQIHTGKTAKNLVRKKVSIP